jgi:proline dehydrogenase
MIPELPAEVLERLIVRPEDLPEQVEKNIRKYKVNLLRMLEVRNLIYLFIYESLAHSYIKSLG